MDMRNAPAAPRTIGVEEELLLVDPRTGRPTAAVESVLSSAAQFGPSEEETSPALPVTRLEYEAKQEQVEAISSPSLTLDGLSDALAAGRRLADDAAQRIGARAVALGTSVLPVASHLTRGRRYAQIERQFGLIMKDQLTCGFHVHVSIADEHEGVAVLDRIRPWLPQLLALSANSPMWDGRDSGFSSYRYQVWSRWPGSGAYEVFGSARAYHRAVDALLATGVLLDPGMVYFDARLSERFPTVEIRVADACTEPSHAVAVAGLVRALVDTAAQEWRIGEPPAAVPTPLLKLAMWSASRFGVASTLVDPASGAPREARAAVDALLAHIEPSLARAGDLARVTAAIDDIFTSGNGADRQRQALQRTESLRAVVADATERTNRLHAPPVVGAARADAGDTP